MAGQGTADNMARAHCMLISKASDTHSEYVVLTAVSLQKCLQNVLQYYVICTPRVRLGHIFPGRHRNRQKELLYGPLESQQSLVL